MWMDGDEYGYIGFYTLDNTVIKYDVLPFIGDDDDDDDDDDESPVDVNWVPSWQIRGWMDHNHV